jgi:flagellar export protein FliJ
VSRWGLGPLLLLRERREERAALDHAGAVAALRDAEASARAARQAARRQPAPSAPASVGELGAAARFGGRLEAAAREEVARVDRLREGAARARAAHAVARREREALDELRRSWDEQRRHRRALAEEGEIDDVAAARRRPHA